MPLEVVEIVEVRNSTDRNEAYTLFVNAAQGHFKSVMESGNAEDIHNLEAEAKKVFDRFAQKCFDEGRRYEQNRAGKL